MAFTGSVIVEVTCTDCTAELEHCHGTLIVHADGAVDCTKQDCSDWDPARHSLRLNCADETPDCECVQSEQQDGFSLAS
jgi:hypothetical protein